MLGSGQRKGLTLSELPIFPCYHDCVACELHETATNVGVPTIHYKQSAFPSPEKPFIIVVGMNPGLNEDKQNEPFVGPTGKMLKNVYLESMGILQSHVVWFTNAARCCTPGNTNLRNTHVKACWPHLEADIQKIRDFHTVGGAILCLGTHAVQTISKNIIGKTLTLSKAISMQGDVIADNLHFFATYHPAGVMRSPKLKFAVAEHLELIGQQLQGKVPSPSLPNFVPIRSPR